MKRTILNTIITFVLILFLGNKIAFSQPKLYEVSDKINIGGETRWDYLSIDYTYNRLFVSHASKVHVVDLKTNKLVGEISDLHGVHGIEFAAEFNKGFISNGRDSSITVFDLKSLQKLASIKINGKNPDAIIYDPFTKRIFSFNHSSNNATAIDAKTNSIIATFPLDGVPEFAASDLKGSMYVNLEDKSAVDVFDPQTLKVIAKWSIAPCEEPTGMAIDNENSRLFVVGGNKLMAVLDLTNGKVITTIPIGSGVDGCAYDSKTNLAFSSNGEGSITVIRQENPNKYNVVETVPTIKGTRTITVDTTTHNVYTLGAVENANEKMFSVIVLKKKK